MSRGVILPVLASILILGTLGVSDAFADHKSTHQSNAGGLPSVQSQVDKLDGHVTVLKGQSEAGDADLQRQIDEQVAIFGDPDFAIFGDPDVAEIFGDPDFAAIFGDPDFLMRTLQDTDENLQRQIDSFFDIFTELQADVDRTNGHVTVLKGQSEAGDADLQRQIDSFFDVWTEVSVHNADVDRIDTEMVALSLRSDQGDADLQTQVDHNEVGFLKGNERSLDADNQHDADIARIDTEILSMDLRGTSCSLGDVVTGVDALGELVCAPDAGSSSANFPQIYVAFLDPPSIAIPPGGITSATLSCNIGDAAISVGWDTGGSNISVIDSIPQSNTNPQSWEIEFGNFASFPASATPRIICADLTP